MRILLLLVIFSSHCLAEVIPAGRRIDWTPDVNVGYRGGIPTTRTEWTNFITAGADPTGVADCQALLTSLFNTCPSNKFIYVPAGVYKLTTTPSWNGTSNGWSLVGIGTNAIFRPIVGMVNFDNNNYGAPIRLHGSSLKGDTSLTTLGQDMSSHIGKLVKVSSSQEGRTDLRIIGINATDRLLAQIVTVETVSNATNFTFSPPLVWSFPTATDPWIQINSTISGWVGFENFTIEGGSGVHFSTFGNQNVYWLGIKSILGSSYFMNSANSTRYTMRGCYSYSTNAGSGSAVVLATGDSACLFENNYSKGGAPMFEINQGVGNVIAYNYSTNSISNDFHVGNPYDHHNPHSMMNLFEGNYGEMFQHDSYFGSASHMTLYKNWFHTKDPARNGMPRAVDLGRWTTYANVVGNVLGSTTRTFHYYITNQFYSDALAVTYRFGFPHPGNATYKSGQITPNMDWRYPGAQNRVGQVNVSSTIPTNRIAMGTYTNVAASGDLLILQSSADTNYYYPFTTNYVILTVVSTNNDYIEVNRNIVSTNLATVYKIGDGSFYEMLDHDQIALHLLHGNYDYTNNAIVWDDKGITTDSNLPSSLYLTSRQPWMTNRAGVELPWPYVNPTNAVASETNWAARSYWEDAARGASAYKALKLRGIRLR